LVNIIEHKSYLIDNRKLEKKHTQTIDIIGICGDVPPFDKIQAFT
jgi:hypothetical protein